MQTSIKRSFFNLMDNGDFDNVEVEVIGELSPSRAATRIDPEDPAEFNPHECWVTFPSSTHPKEQERHRADWLFKLIPSDQWAELTAEVEEEQTWAFFDDEDRRSNDDE